MVRVQSSSLLLVLQVKLRRLRELAAAEPKAALDQAALADMRSALEYKQMQAQSSTDTAVRAGSSTGYSAGYSMGLTTDIACIGNWGYRCTQRLYQRHLVGPVCMTEHTRFSSLCLQLWPCVMYSVQKFVRVHSTIPCLLIFPL